MDKDILLFDLDGTLTDPMVGITKSVQYALRHYGIIEEDLTRLIPFIGPPLRDSFQKYYGFSKEQASEGVLVYREYFSEKGIFENKEIPGIREMLEALNAQGKKLYVATSKPEVYAKKILEYFSLDHFFTFIGGADFGETRVNKADVIRYVLEKTGLCCPDKEEADRSERAELAKNTDTAEAAEGTNTAERSKTAEGTNTAERSEAAKGTNTKEKSKPAEGTDTSKRTELRKKKIVMIGDREHDILGAKENGIQSVGVLFGYGSRRELEEAGADRIAETVEDLIHSLLMDWSD